MDLRTTLENLATTIQNEFGQVLSLEHLEKLRVEYLGRKGILTDLMSRLQELPKEERPTFGQQTNALKQKINQLLEEKKAVLKKKEEEAFIATFDPTLQSRQPWKGSIHPINLVMEDICHALEVMGFDVVVGPEAETDYYNFQTLNFPDDHPARDMQDTLFITEKVLMRTHTSPMQVRSMLERKPPLAVIAPGKVYRRDSDITHTPMFHQVEGLLVDTHISLAHLRGILSSLCKTLFGEHTLVRFRPSFFPFTEPSMEVDISCMNCKGAGHIGNEPCRICKTTGWLEILGSGMIDPNVFKAVGYDPKKVSGFAFGMGVERTAMLKYGITDLRMNFENDIRFLNQFAKGDAWRRN